MKDRERQVEKEETRTDKKRQVETRRYREAVGQRQGEVKRD